MGRLASLFSPFWCLDAKGGEVALFRLLPGFAWVGHKLRVSICILLLVSTLSYLVLFVVELCGLVVNLFICVCKTCGARYAKW
jgi:hypothetical protein